MSDNLPYFPSIRTTLGFDRMSGQRTDDEWVSRQRRTESAKFLVLVDARPVLCRNGSEGAGLLRWFSNAEVTQMGLGSEEALLLGSDPAGIPYFSISISEWTARKRLERWRQLEDNFELRGLAIEGAMSPEELSVIGQAKALAHWNLTHKCCGKCGAATKSRDGGWRRQCWSCGQSYFPRSDPAVIMLVTDGSRFILGKEERFRDRFMSVIAGFVEPGESIEHAVRRETMEETGIEVGDVRYVASQPWPFPHNIMIGCRAEALTTEFKLNDSELLEARWVGREEAKLMLDKVHPEHINVPPPISIAHMLISQFADGII